MIPFAGNPLNRASEKRTNSGWIEAKRRDPTSLILPMRRLEPFLLGPEKSKPPVELGLLKSGIADSTGGGRSRVHLSGSRWRHGGVCARCLRSRRPHEGRTARRTRLFLRNPFGGANRIVETCGNHRASQGTDRLASAARFLPALRRADENDGCRVTGGCAANATPNIFRASIRW